MSLAAVHTSSIEVEAIARASSLLIRFLSRSKAIWNDTGGGPLDTEAIKSVGKYERRKPVTIPWPVKQCLCFKTTFI